MAEKTYVTQEGYNELKQELDHLVHVVRKEVITELQEARAQGDLSENADYDAARDRQARVEARILELEALIKNAELITETPKTGRSSTVHLGSTVKVEDLSDHTQNEYTIVGTIEADPFKNLISNDSPFAKAIMDHQPGEIVTVTQVAEPYDVRIIDVH